MAELLRDTFGLDSWRTNQKEIINATLSNRDAFVVMRTGGGKSLCYQLPAVLKGGITVGGLVFCGGDTRMYGYFVLYGLGCAAGVAVLCGLWRDAQAPCWRLLRHLSSLVASGCVVVGVAVYVSPTSSAYDLFEKMVGAHCCVRDEEDYEPYTLVLWVKVTVKVCGELRTFVRCCCCYFCCCCCW